MSKIITTEKEILSAYNNSKYQENVKSNVFYILESEEEFTISNVPKIFYKKNYHTYRPPAEAYEKNKKLIALLKQNIDILHTHPNGKKFQLNSCFHNSVSIYDYLQGLDVKKFNVDSPVEIVFGYISRDIPSGTSIDEKIVTKNLVIHEWHIWNYINNFLLDATILNTAPTVKIDMEIKWGEAKDHIFFYPPKDTKYHGANFNNFNNFFKYYKNIFKHLPKK